MFCSLCAPHLQPASFRLQDRPPASDRRSCADASPEVTQSRKFSSTQRSELVQIPSNRLLFARFTPTFSSPFWAVQEGRPLPSSPAAVPAVLRCSSAVPAPPAAAAAPLPDPRVGEQPRLRWDQQLCPIFSPHVALHQRPSAHLISARLSNAPTQRVVINPNL